MINNDKEYQKALERIEVIFDAEPNTKEGDELKSLVAEVIIYERKVHPVILTKQSEKSNEGFI